MDSAKKALRKQIISVVIWIIFAVLMGIVCAALHELPAHCAGQSNANIKAKKALFQSIKDNDIDTACEIIEKYPTLVDECEYENNPLSNVLEDLGIDNQTPLLRACKYGEERKEFVRLFVENGADVNKCVNGNYPLIQALCSSDIESAEYLIENGADLLVSSGSCWNVPCAVASIESDRADTELQRRCLEIFKAAVDKGASVFPKEGEAYGYGSKMTSIHEGHEYFVSSDNAGMTSVYGIAARTNQALIVEYFLKNGLSSVDEIVYVLDEKDQTALIVAAQYEAYDVVKLLLDYGADKSITDKNGKTAYDYAVMTGVQILIALLR